MNTTAPKGLGIITVATVFGIIGAGVAWVMWEMGALGSIFVGILVAIVVMILLSLGWREPAGRNPQAPLPTRADAPTAARSGTSAGTTTPAAAAVAEPVAAPSPAEAAASATAVEPTIDNAPAATPEVTPVAAPAAAEADAAAVAVEPTIDEKPAAKAKATKAKTATQKAAAPEDKPEMLSAPRGGAGDDLKQIKGVGPKLEKMLNTMGVWHFDQVASWQDKEVAWVDQNLEGFKGRVSRDNWVAQAKVLAEGGTTEFSNKVKKGDVY